MLLIATALFCTALTAITPDEVLDYWFRPNEPMEEQVVRWFGSGGSTDREIADQFGEAVAAAANGAYQEWTTTPEGRLALIILLDQFPRQIYRDTPQAFATDPLAQQIALEGLMTGDDVKLPAIQRTFYYLPFEHAENLELQNLSVAKFTNLLHALDVYDGTLFKSFLDYAERHHRVITRFGRFPHRNALLDRPSTPTEESFLQSSDAPF